MKWFFLLIGLYFAVVCLLGGNIGLGVLCAGVSMAFQAVFYGTEWISLYRKIKHLR